jgi:hypothetical protein
MAVIAAAVSFVATSCNAPDNIAKFCSSAVATLGTSNGLLDDMKASCVRESQTRESFGSFVISDPIPAACIDVGNQAEGLKAASKVLSSYFTALNDLASFGSTKAGEEATGLVNRASSSRTNLNAASQKALASIAGLLIRLGTSGYQQKQLADDIVNTHADIKVAIDGLAEAVGVAYLHQLQDEEAKTATRYKEFLLGHQTAADAILVLDSRWQSDRSSFAAKQNAALSYQTALNTIAKGNEDLAAHARSLKAKELPGLLSPYAAELESLVPAIQKAFQ